MKLRIPSQGPSDYYCPNPNIPPTPDFGSKNSTSRPQRVRDVPEYVFLCKKKKTKNVLSESEPMINERGPGPSISGFQIERLPSSEDFQFSNDVSQPSGTIDETVKKIDASQTNGIT